MKDIDQVAEECITPNVNPSSIYFIARRFEHHSQSSGYDRLCAFFPEGRLTQPFKHSLISRSGDSFYCRFLRKHVGSKSYSLDAWRRELPILLQGRFRHEGVYHNLYGDDQWGVLRGLPKSPLVVTFHQPPAVLAQMVRANMDFKRISQIICVARSQVGFFQQHVASERIHFVPHGVDVDSFQPPPERIFRQEGPWHCLVVGNWLRDTDTLHRVADQLYFRHGNQVRLTVLAKPEAAHGLHLCENIEVRSGLSESELRHLYWDCDLLVLPLKDATANNGLLEGMACGSPIVITDVGGIRDYADESCAMLVPPGDSSKMLEAILAALANPLLRQSLSHAARRRALDFDWRIIAKKMREVYSSV